MKAKELIEILKDLPEFEVELSKTILTPNEGYGLKYERYEIEELVDIGYSDKIIIFEIKES